MTHGMQMEVEKFDKLVHETKQALDSNRIKRFLHLNGKNEERLSLFKHRLEEAHDNISAAAADCLQRSANSSSRSLSALADITKTFLTVLNKTAAAFPPLKSVTAGVLEIWRITERVKALRDNAQKLEDRYDKMFENIHQFPDFYAVPPAMQVQIAQFDKLRHDTKPKLRSIQKKTRMTRLIHLNRYEKRLSTFDLRLKEAHDGVSMVKKFAMNTNSGVKPKKVGTRRKGMESLVSSFYFELVNPLRRRQRSKRIPK
ncbi:hypothetical protein C0993_006250 [Termitomyces sp. T159_Od127]|nr:hypothetical protein C0993_006250 [Termitomyces sp. T159_Od127]